MILQEIIKEKYTEIGELKQERRSLSKGLQQSEITLIAEIKKASPSKGLIAANFDPEEQLFSYERGGANAISILTDSNFFQGDKSLLQKLRLQTDLPILRKDFILDPIQIYESFFLGADIVLLIVAALSQERLRELVGLSHDLGMEALVEVHQAPELEKALNVGAKIIGINNRDLRDFTVDLQTTERVVKELERQKIREDYYLISESGIRQREDITYLESLGVDGVLIGETLMRSSNPVRTIGELLGRVLVRE